MTAHWWFARRRGKDNRSVIGACKLEIYDSQARPSFPEYIPSTEHCGRRERVRFARESVAGTRRDRCTASEVRTGGPVCSSGRN